MNRLQDVISTSALDVKRHFFLATHTPFRRLNYIKSGNSDINVLPSSEEEVYEDLLFHNMDQHKFCAVIGNNGSGKSHFIKWLYEKVKSDINPESEQVLLISRSQCTLKGAIKQLLESDLFEDQAQNNTYRALVDADNNISNNQLISLIVANFAATIDSDESEEILNKREKKALYEFFVDSYVKDNILQTSNGPIERIRRRIQSDPDNQRKDDEVARFKESDFVVDPGTLNKMKMQSSRRARQCAQHFEDPDNGSDYRKRVTAYVNTKVDQVIQNTLRLRSTDLKDVFEDIRKELKLQGKTLILLIEDISMFTGIDKGLIEVLITSHKGEKINEQLCRLISVIGVTTEYYNQSFPDNLKDRITSRVVIEDSAVFKDQKHLCEFTAKYINALLVEEDNLIKWTNNGANQAQIPRFEAIKHLWSNYYLNEVPWTLYPFNPPAVWSLYSSLEVKTPRRFLMDILRNLLEHVYINKHALPPNSNELKSYGIHIPGWKEPLNRQNARTRALSEPDRVEMLFLIWGAQNVNPMNSPMDGITKEIVDDFKLEINLGDELPTPPLPPTQLEPQINEGRTETAPPLQIVDAILAWGEGQSFTGYREIKTTLYNLFFDFVDWDAHGINPHYAFNHRRVQNISIQGQTDQVLKDAFVVKRNTSSVHALIAVANYLYIGKKEWDINNVHDHLTNLISWFIENEEAFIKSQIVYQTTEDRAFYEASIANRMIYEFILFGAGKTLISEEAVYTFCIGELNNYSKIKSDKRSIRETSNKSAVIYSNWEHNHLTGLQMSPYPGSERPNDTIFYLLSPFYLRIGNKSLETTASYFFDAARILKCLTEQIASGFLISDDRKIRDIGYPTDQLIAEKYRLMGVGAYRDLVLEEIRALQKRLKETGFNFDEDFSADVADLMNSLEQTREPYKSENIKLLISDEYGIDYLQEKLKELDDIVLEKEPFNIIHEACQINFYYFDRLELALEDLNAVILQKTQKFYDDIQVLQNDLSGLSYTQKINDVFQELSR